MEELYKDGGTEAVGADEDSLRLWFGLRHQKHSDFTHLPSEKSIKPLKPDIERVKLAGASQKIFFS